MRSATALVRHCQRQAIGDRQRPSLPDAFCRHLSSLAQVDEIDSSNASKGWTLDRERRLRSVLSGKAEVPTGLDLAKETYLAASWHSANGKIDDLSKLVKRAERFVSKSQDMDNVVPYEAAIRFLIQSAESQPAHLIEADKMMKSLFDKARDGSRSVSFRTLNDLLGHVVTAWARVRLDSVGPLMMSGKTKTGSKPTDKTHTVPADAAESWLRLWVHHAQVRNMHSSNTEQESLALGPGALVFGACIDSHGKSRRRGSAHRAEELLEWLIDLGKNTPPGNKQEQWIPPRPNAVMFTSVIDACARTAHNNPEAVRSAESWLAIMEENYFDKGMVECKPSAIAYTSVIMAYSRRGGARGGGGRLSRDHHNEPDMISDAEKAEDVLLRLMERNENFLEQTEIKDSSADGSIRDPSLVEIDVNILNGLIDCWARQAGAATSQEASLAAAYRAESWLAVLLRASAADESFESEGQNVPLATRSILESHQKESTLTSGLLGSLPTLLAASMVSADVVSFNSAISAFSRVRNCLEAAQGAQRCFEAMKEQNIEPTSITFGAIVLAWGNTRSSEGAVKATLYLDEYETMGRAKKLKPHVIVYNNTLNAWASSSRKDALPKMRIILDRMERSGSVDKDENSALVPPDIVSYHTFMKACTYEARKNPSESFAYFLSVMDKLTGEDPAIVPESSTFLSVLLCIGQCVVSPKERCDERYLDMLKIVFDRCCKQGLVSQAFLGTLRSILPEGNRREEILADVMGVSVTDVSAEGDLHIHPEWRRNLQGKDRGGRGRTHGSATRSGAKHSEDLRKSSRQHIRR